MATLTKDSNKPQVLGNVQGYPVIASDIIYEGAAVGDNGSGYARPLQSGDPFLGFCEQQIDNSSGSAGDVNVRVVVRGTMLLSISGVALTSVGKPVYATDDNTFVLTGVGTKIGRVIRYVSTGKAEVEFDVSGISKEEITTLQFPVDLANISDADVVTGYTLTGSGQIKSLAFVVNTPVTTADKGTTLNAEIGTTDLTGGVVTLTSANCTPLGAVVAGTAVTAGGAFSSGDTLSIEATSTTAFVEGSGTIVVTIGS